VRYLTRLRRPLAETGVPASASAVSAASEGRGPWIVDLEQGAQRAATETGELDSLELDAAALP
jgi:hypothetical protein